MFGRFYVSLLKNYNIDGNFKVVDHLELLFINKFNNNLDKNKRFDICLIEKNLVKFFQSVQIYENKVIPEYLILLENLKDILKRIIFSVVCCKITVLN